LESLGEAATPFVKLAVTEINKAGGLPGGADGRRRPLAVLACDETAQCPAVGGMSMVCDPPERAMNHLVKDVGVPATMGPNPDFFVIPMATQIAIPNKVMVLAPTNNSTSIEDIKDNGLVWSLIGTELDEVGAMDAFNPQLEAKTRTQLGLPST